MSLLDELRKAVEADDTPKVQGLLDRLAAQYREPLERKIAAIKTAYKN